MNPLSALVLFCVTIGGVARAQGSDTAPGVLVHTTTLVSKQVRQTISAYGVVEPDADALIVVALPRAGLITRLHVRQGERVNAGDALLVLDTAPGTRLQYVQASAARQYAEGQLARTQQLFSEQMATRDQLASAERALRNANAELDALKSVGADQSQQTIRANAAGIITSLAVNTGDRVAADTPALFLAQSSGFIVRLGIEPEDARRIADQSAVELVSVFQRDIRIPSRLTKVNAMINPATRLVDAVAPIPASAAQDVTLGITMQVEVVLSEQSIPIVPRSAVLRDQLGAHVFTVEDGRARRVAVTVVYESADESGISSDLEIGSTVVKTGNYELSDGIAVRVRNDAP